ncbi:type I-PGING CRISPR-associated protein Cas7/Csp1 [Spirosoma sp. 48-14]|uniref:type I-PGING CRISPR-associated protein Cas7/Csp1 n=1 Tax=Spirosoma sp. 48-14 TaxID=1895854 RepID=UPI000968DB78|nr:type I-PGING CRISPR-associated protein Cas7/Csp1 [Spirosoma sp. 48-14]OJW70707.1 MAG: type I-PGING CRISPR-associated protein Cas7/Csp1 [Spirosoma sp. 48-14]
MEISGILVSIVAPFDYHMANGGEKLLGNASSIKRTPDGKVYVSGQMQRHVLFSAMSRLNAADPDRAQTYVSNGDGVSNHIEVDLRADMGGFMHPSRGDYSGRRTAPLSATMAVALEESKVGRDLLIRLKQDPNEDSRDQALATREFSENDMMLMNFYLDITSLSTSKAFRYQNSFHLETTHHKHAPEAERMRRVRLFLEATRSLQDYSNQARNAVSGEPLKVLIVFDTKHSRKAARYFSVGETQQKNILAELQSRNAQYFLGDDDTDESVFKAYEEALTLLASSTLTDLSEGDSAVMTFEEFAGRN